jgi:predicted transposase YdaD
MPSDSFFFNLLLEAGTVLLRCAGFTDLRAGDYTFTAVELKAFNRRIDAVGLPTTTDKPLILIEFYDYKHKRPYRNALHKLFQYIEDQEWNGDFKILLIFAHRHLDPGDPELDTALPFLERIYLDEWLTSQPEDPYTNCLRLLVEKEEPKRDFDRLGQAIRWADQTPRDSEERKFVELYTYAVLVKYEGYTLDKLLEQMELKRTQDLMKNELFRTFYNSGKDAGLLEGKLEGKFEGLLEGERKGKAEAAWALHRKLGLNAEQIADTLEVPLEQVRQWLGQ